MFEATGICYLEVRVGLSRVKKNFIKHLLTLIICFSCCLVANAETHAQTPEKQNRPFSNYLEKAKAWGHSYKIQLEIKYYQERIKKSPNDVELLKTFAKYLKDHKYYGESQKIYKKIIALTKNNAFQKDIDEIKAFQASEKKEKIFSDYIKQAQKYESQGNIVKANEYYLKAQKISPERYEVAFGLAKTYCWLKEPSIAEKKYEKLLKKTPDNVDLLEAYANCLKDNKNYARAIIIYKKLLALTKDEKYNNNLQEIIDLQKGHAPKASPTELARDAIKDKIFMDFIKQAQKYESQGNIKKANEYYLKAQKEEPNRYEARFGLAKTYGWLGQNKLALAYYKGLLKDSPGNPDFAAAYNKFLKETRQPKPSRVKLKQGTQAQNVNAESDKAFSEFIKQAQALENQGKAAEANEYYLKASKIYPLRYEAKFGLAKTYGLLHQDDLALKYYKELLTQTPDNTDLLGAYANYLKDTKNYPEAMGIYKKLLAQSKEAKYKTNIAEILFLQKDYQAALALYFEIYNQNPNDPETQKSIALVYFTSGDFKSAIDFYEKYLTQVTQGCNSKPLLPEAVLNYGKSLFYSKQVQSAKAVLESYVSVYPNDAEGLSTLADIYVATKNVPMATALINKATSIEPENIKFQIQSAKIDIAAKNYCKAQTLLLQLLAAAPTNSEIIESLGDISFYTSNFGDALGYYQSIPDCEVNQRLVYKIAQSYHYGKNHTVAQNLYRGLLDDPEYSNKSKIGLAEIQIEKDKPLKARAILNNVLRNDPENIQAKKNLAIAYVSTGDNLTSIKILESLPTDDSDINYNLAKAYNNIERKDTALELLKDNPQDNAKALKSEILMQIKPAVEPIYNYYFMNAEGSANAGKYHKAGLNGYYYIRPNLRAVLSATTTRYENYTNIVQTWGTLGSVGLEGKPTDHLAFKSAIGVDVFSNSGNLVLGNVVGKYSFNDVITMTSGYIRSLDEIDSYMSAAGVIPTTGPFANQLVGRIVDNKYVVANFGFKLPHKFYAYAGLNVGNKYGSNSPSNFYKEIPMGFGKVVYSAPEEKPVNQALLGYDFYYTGYNRDQSGFGGANLNYNPIGSDGQSPYPSSGFPGVGGYFSPTFFIANKIPLTVKGSFKNNKLKYIVSAFIGTQTIEGQIGLLGPVGTGVSPITTSMYFGYSIGLRYNEKGRIGWGLDYIFNNYMTVAQHLVKASLLIRF